jgi:hypothetical protein
METNSHEDDWAQLRDPAVVPQRVLTIATLVFSLAFCALVFSAGLREVAAFEHCGVQGLLSAGRACPVQTVKHEIPAR